MKILYITNYLEIARASGGYFNDYQNDLLFYGLKEVLGDDVTDSTPIVSLYKQYQNQIDKRNLWGGMTAFWLLDQDTADRSDINDRIKSRYYDYIVYGAIKRCKDYLQAVTKYYPPDRVIMVDGNDESELDPLYEKYMYFKRELTIQHPNLQPITFAMPTNKMSGLILNKTQDYGTVIPGEASTYIFTKEEDYFADYQKSYYGVTMKKAGWDAMRHYEIMGNSCLPYFTDIEQCPKDTLANMPKEMLIEAKHLAENFNEQSYNQLLKDVYSYTEAHLTTKALAESFLEKIIK